MAEGMVSVTGYDRYARRLRLFLEFRGYGRNGLLIVDQYLDLFPLHLIFRSNDRVGGRIIPLGNRLLELERRQDDQPERLCLIEEYCFGQSDGGSAPPGPDVRHLLAHLHQRLLKVLEVPRKESRVRRGELLEGTGNRLRDPLHVVEVVPHMLIVGKLVAGNIVCLQQDTLAAAATLRAACPSSRRSRRRSR